MRFLLKKFFSPHFFLHSSVLFLFSSFLSCRPDIEIPEPLTGEADFNSTVAIGGNYLAGYQDGALYPKGQKNSIPSLLATRFQLVKGSSCDPPLVVDDNGIGLNSKPWESMFVTRSKLNYKQDCLGKTSLSPVKELFNLQQASEYLYKVPGRVRNLAVPFATTKELFSPSLGNPYGEEGSNPFYRRFAITEGVSTVFSDALRLEPTFALVWLGMEDVYEYARVGGFGKTILPASQFSLYLDSILKPLSEKGCKGVIANIPELKIFPFYSLVPWNGMDLDQVKADTLNVVTGGFFNFQVGKNGFVAETKTASEGFRKLKEGERILLTVPLDSMKCQKMGAISFIPDRYVLDAAEIANVEKAISDYNTIIEAKAVQYGFAFADMKSFFRKVAGGIRWNGVDYNADFVSGGFFSLDGYHPNQKGYEMIANEFIAVINAKYGSSVPTVYCEDCTGVLFP